METGGDEERSLAFEVKGRLRVIVEEGTPYVKIGNQTYFVNEPPSVIVGGKKHFVSGIF
ncbi:MAG: hypothetical protein QXT25_00115 [Candidatus Anstonellaceae archaeon]